MIASRKRMNTPSKSSITRLISYLTNTQGSSERVGEVRITGCESEEAGWAAMEMLAVQQQNTRAKGDKTYHLILSFREQLSSRQLAAIEKRVCDALGYGQHQRVSVVHGDTENQHLHIAINKIHPTRFTMHEPYYDKNRLAKVCVELERDFGLIADNHEARSQARDTAATAMEKAGDMESLIGWIRRNCLNELKEADSWKDFNRVLAEHGLSIKASANGFTITDGTVHARASSVDRSLSKMRLEKRLGAFERGAAGKVEPKRRYVRQPLSGNTSLWEAYRREDVERLKRVGEALAERMERGEESIQDFRFRNAVIKYMTSGVTKRILYHLSRSKLQREKKKQWMDWLRSKAGEKSSSVCSGALGYLQSRAGTVSGNYAESWIAGTERETFPDPVVVTRKGMRIFKGGIRERDGKLLIPAGANDAELGKILDFAQRYYRYFAISGPARERMLELSAARERSRSREQSRGRSR